MGQQNKETNVRTIPRLSKPKRPINPYGKNKFIKTLYNSSAWVNLRWLKLSNNPLCERCLERDRINAATEVHHIKPISSGVTSEEMRDLCLDYSNLMSLCNLCHIKIHKELKKI